jgi:hypothetical protein
MKEKDQIGADIYIEDRPDNVERLRRQNHYVICFANSTNVHLGSPRADTWQEVYDHIKEKAPTATHLLYHFAMSIRHEPRAQSMGMR